MSSALGIQILAEFFGCPHHLLDDAALVEQAMLQAAQAAQAHILHASFHRFAPQGVSGVVVIQESHLTIHTWPEHGYAAVDIFTCGNKVQPWQGFRFLKQALGARQSQAVEVERGRLVNG